MPDNPPMFLDSSSATAKDDGKPRIRIFCRDSNALGAEPASATVTEAYLGYARLEDADLQQLRKFPHLKVLKLNGTHISDAGLLCLAELNELEELDLRYTKVTGSGLRDLGCKTSLKTLSLSLSAFEPKNAPFLCTFSNLERLNVARTKFDDYAASSIACLTRLRELDISFSNVSNKGIRFLAKLPDLKSLSMIRTNISDGAAPHIGSMRNLEILHIGSTKIRRLNEIARLPNLRCLHASGNPVTDNDIIPLAKTLTLEALLLDDTKVTGRSLKYFQRKDSKLQSLAVSPNISDDGIQSIKGFRNLTSLYLWRNDLSDSNICALSELDKLQVLRIRGPAITRESINYFKQLNQLSSLSLMRTRT